ncbi:MAG: TonB-dependent receptor [Bacteroidales bacterium]|nr:TonB-dependent receptor [Bacteroidales bacterium]
MKKNVFILFILMFLTTALVNAQVSIKGKVLDENNQVVIGASILEKGTTNGTNTDVDGNFTLTVKSVKSSLVISYIGMKNQTILVENNLRPRVVLKSNSVELNEVVAVGYGTMRKSDITGSLSSVKVKDTETTSVISVDQMLKGKSSGVYVNTSSAEPGGVSSVKVRGVNSLTGDTEPLYVIDGIAMDNVGGTSDPFNKYQQKVNPLAYLSPQDIVNIEILKDASATAIFGSRGANGVVLVTTKNGSVGKAKVNFIQSLTVSQTRKKIQMLNGPDYARYRNELALLEGRTSVLYGMTESTLPENLQWKDWQGEVLQTAISSNSRISISGGSKNSDYYLSGGYDSNEGIVKNTFFNRGDVRFNFNTDVSTRLRLNFNIAAASIKSKMTQTTGSGGTFNYSAIRSMLSKNPIINYVTADDTQSELNTPLAWINDYKDDNIENNVLSRLGLTYKISKVFSYEIRGSYYYKNIERFRYYGRTLSSFAYGGAGYSSLGYWGYNIDNLLNFDYSFNKSNRISGVVGATYSANDSRTLSYYATGFENDNLSYEQIGDATDVGQKLKRLHNESKLNSYLARGTYNLKDKYMLTVSGRVDGSSKFANGNKYAFFPSFALAWRIKEEAFLRNVDEISNLKLRFGWGQTGSQNIPPYSSVVTYSTFGYSSYSYGGQLVTGKYISSLSNKDLKWETSEQVNAGIDLGLLNERIGFIIDVYYKKNTDMLIKRPLPASFGYSSALVNFGAIENKGIDFSTNLVLVDKKKFMWTVDGNISLYRNKILELGLPKDANTGLVSYTGSIIHPIGDLNIPGNIFIEGKPAGLFWGFSTNGVYQNQQQIDDFVAEAATRNGTTPVKAFYFGRSPKPGEIIYLDKSGNGIIDSNDYGVIGNPNPDFTWGANTNLAYGKWNLLIAVNGVYGKDVLNANLNTENRMNGSIYNIRKEAWDRRWTGEGTSNYYPIPYSKTIGNVISDRLIEDASFVRLSAITLSYNAKIPANFFMKELKIFVTGNNILTLTNYSGFDPEVDSFAGDAMRVAIDNNSYPSSKSVIFGFNFNL